MYVADAFVPVTSWPAPARTFPDSNETAALPCPIPLNVILTILLEEVNGFVPPPLNVIFPPLFAGSSTHKLKAEPSSVNTDDLQLT